LAVDPAACLRIYCPPKISEYAREVSAVAINYKWQWFFESPDGAGVGEVYWSNQGTSLSTSATAMDTLLTLRLATLPATWYCRYAKAHDLRFPRSVVLSPSKLCSPGTLALVAPDNVPNQDENCLLMSYRGLSDLIYKKYLHGIGNWTGTGESYGPSAGFATAISAFLDQFKISCQVPLGFVKGIPQNNENVTSAQIQGVTTHRVGRPFGQPVGRRRRKKRPSIPVVPFVTSSGPAMLPAPASGAAVTSSTSHGTGLLPAPST
jgi:hypothetical protein